MIRTISPEQLRAALHALGLVPEQVVSVVITCAEVTVKTRAADVTMQIAVSSTRLWTCPVCWRSYRGTEAPAGWLVVEPFTRVAACAGCRPHFEDAQ